MGSGSRVKASLEACRCDKLRNNRVGSWSEEQSEAGQSGQDVQPQRCEGEQLRSVIFYSREVDLFRAMASAGKVPMQGH